MEDVMLLRFIQFEAILDLGEFFFCFLLIRLQKAINEFLNQRLSLLVLAWIHFHHHFWIYTFSCRASIISNIHLKLSLSILASDLIQCLIFLHLSHVSLRCGHLIHNCILRLGFQIVILVFLHDRLHIERYGL